MKINIKKILFLTAIIILIFFSIKRILMWSHALFVTLNIVDNKKFTFIDNFYKIKQIKKHFKLKNEIIPVKIFADDFKTQKPAIFLAHGLAPNGYNDSRLVRFAKSLAKTGLIIFLPNFSFMKNIRIKKETSLKMRFLFDEMQKISFINRDKIHIFSISYAGGPATIAFSHKKYRNKVNLIIYLGGYYNLKNVLVFGLSGKSKFKKYKYYTKPSTWGRWYYLVTNLEYIKNENDKKLLYKIAETKRRYPWYNTEKLEKKLTDEGKELLAMIKQKQPATILKLIKNQSEKFKNTLKVLSPEYYIKKLSKNKIILLHSSNDPLVPFTESFYFRKELIKHGANPSLSIINALSHVNIIKKPFNFKNIISFYLPELIKMTNIVYEVINYD